jgi:hypothetical protein
MVKMTVRDDHKLDVLGVWLDVLARLDVNDYAIGTLPYAGLEAFVLPTDTRIDIHVAHLIT